MLYSSILIVLIFKSFIFCIDALPSSTPLAMNSCKCTRVKDCVTYTNLLRQINDMMERIRMASCSSTFDTDNEPMICCPTADTSTTKSIRSYNTEIKMPNEDRWIWDRRPKIPNNSGEIGSIDFQSKFLDEPHYNFIKTNLIDDYFNWKTRRNCPPILYKEKRSFHGHFDSKHHPINYDYHNFHPHRAHHNNFDWNHDHHHNSFHGSHEFSDEDDGDDTHHRFWPPPIWSDSEPSPSNNRDQHFPLSPSNNRDQHFPSFPKPTTTTRRPTIPTTTTTVPTTQKPTINSPSCGITLNKRIIGGIEALPGEFPWITRIAYLNTSDNTLAYRCTGSFITEIHILTAAHCVSNLDGALTLSHISLVDLNVSNEQTAQSIYEISETFVHPNYDTPKRANDIAIIKIIKPSDVPEKYGTICLPTLTNSGGLLGSTGVVAGWSNIEGTTDSDLRVRYLRLPILNNTECSNRYDMFRQGFAEKITIDSGMLCTQGQSNGSDVCRGDSGGPLMDDGSSAAFNSEGRYTLIGIVAFGPICGFTNLVPGVYMRVSEFVQWITDSIR